MSNSSKENKKFLKESTLNSETRRPRPKRRIVPSNVKVSTAPQLTDIINDALSIIGSELAAYNNKVKKGVMLDLKEARTVGAYMDSLTRMAKEAREAQQPKALEHLTDEELLAIASQALQPSEAKNTSTSSLDTDTVTSAGSPDSNVSADSPGSQAFPSSQADLDTVAQVSSTESKEPTKLPKDTV